MQKSPAHVVRRLCAPPSAPTSSSAPGPLYVSDAIDCGGIPPQELQRQLVSSSFLPPLRASLPLAEDEGAFGGLWFWESYRRMLWGCDVLLNLSGTGVSLSEDTIETQKQLRLRAIKEWRQQHLSDKGDESVKERNPRIGLYASAKLEVLFATALSVAVHVAQQPILEKAQGPQALVLCATKDQCDEFTHILNYFCSELHLVVHNLFDLYPSIPSDKRAEIVVGTPPLWDNVIPPSTTTMRAARRVGLEDLLSVVYDGPSPTYVTTRWRPYTADFISQLVLCDVEQQTDLGFGPLLTRWLRNEADSPLPRDHQLYILMGNGHVPYAHDQASRVTLLRQLEERFQFSRGRGHAAVEVGFGPTLSTQLPPPPPSPPTGRKRGRDDADDESSDTHRRQTSARDHGDAPLSCGVLVRKALSFPRLLLDASAFTDLLGGIAEEVRSFWSHYHVDMAAEQRDGAGTVTADVPGDGLNMERVVQFSLAFICTPVGTAGNSSSSPLLPTTAPTLLQEACLLVQPSAHMNEAHMQSRYTLLFKHLEDKLNGMLFDGSVMSLVNMEDAQLGVTYQPVAPVTMRQFTSLGTQCALRQGPATQFPSVYLCAVEATTTISAAKREKELEELRATRQRICEYFEAEAGTHRDANDGDAIDQVPIGAFLPDWGAHAHPFSVMVLRGFTLPRELLCGCPQSGRKPLILFYLEECTQYGRLVSYYCFEKKHSDCDADGADKAVPLEGTRVTAETSLFLEFSSHEAAAEAVRLFSFRQDTGSITAKLFRVGVYYAGVKAEEEKRHEGGGDDDSDLWFDLSLLAE
ncbi:hypothetical protein STCU_09011 [Strigomonas culicis]|uniref:Uncharacterized protein n=1 Tax=Strigomonas culicis TaxID=28005 RepID=S9VBF5_9TRYP|nr:hypothetical protein STCU_09011 [Strigomonas culicis]|eukprot:EPY20395.1 hypothetical protein STCU_09011 [Strigomonas culicis]